MRIIKGSLPPSVFCPSSKKTDDVTGQVKVKRKCGRPRNPIPRHKRESHINAEHRRRGKIQDGFRTLKNIVPKYEQASGRDSKADILFKAVDHCKLLQNDIQKLNSSIETLKAERDALSADIKNYKTLVPDMSIYDDMPLSMDDRYADYVQQKTKEHWAFGTFKVIMRPLFESYKLSTVNESMSEFVHSVAEWASHTLSPSNLRTVCLTTMSDVPTGNGSLYKDGLPLDVTNSSGSVGHSLVSDNNNNSNGYTFASDHRLDCHGGSDHRLDCHGGATGICDSVSTEAYGTGFEAYATANNSSPLAKAGNHTGRQHYQDLVPLAGGNICNNSIFSDLYYNTDHDLHHHLSFGKTLDGFDHWSQLRLPQQHHHFYQNNHISPPSSHFHDLKKVHPFWANQHQPPVGDFSLRAPNCYPLSLSDRELSCDLQRPKEKAEISPHLPHPTHFLGSEHARHKDLSPPSVENEGSLFSMETLVKQSTETLGEHHMSPSTNSCTSPDSSSTVASPEVLSARNADFSLSYHRNIPLDDFRQHKPTLHELMDKSVGQLPASLQSYRQASAVEQYRCSMARPERDLGHWAFSTSKNPWGTGSRYQPGSERHESSLLAAMLGQQILLQSKQTHSEDGLMKSPPHTNSFSKNASSIFQVKPAAVGKITDSFINGLSIAVKAEAGYKLPHPNTNTNQSTRHLPLSPSKESHQNQTFQSNTSQTNCFKDPAISDIKHLYSSNLEWLQQYHKTQDSPCLNSCATAKLGEDCEPQNVPQSQICYFEMAHQELLKNQSLSLNHGKVNEFGPANVNRSPPQCSHSPSSGAELLSSNPTCSDQALGFPAVTSSSYLGQSGHARSSLAAYHMTMDTASGQKAGRKNSFEESFPEDHMLQAVSGCKKTCQWQHLSDDKQSLATGGKSTTCDTIRETDCMGKSVETFGETTLRF